MSQKCVWCIWERGNHAIKLTVNLNYTHLYQSNIEVSWTALKRKEEPSKVLVCCDNQNQYSVQDIPISTRHKQKTNCIVHIPEKANVANVRLPSFLSFFLLRMLIVIQFIAKVNQTIMCSLSCVIARMVSLLSSFYWKSFQLNESDISMIFIVACQRKTEIIRTKSHPCGTWKT